MSQASLWVTRAVTPDRTLERVRVTIEDGRIAELVSGVGARAGETRYEDATLVPGLVDLQVNGGDGAAYDDPAPDARARATSFHLQRGTTSLLATLISAPVEELEASLARLAADVDPAGPVIGIHLEGPFLSEEKCGAHARAHLCDPTPERVGRLVRSGGDSLRMVTLAPERAGAQDAIRRFRTAGVVVAAGHSRATMEQLREAIACGLSFMTHVGNASDWPGRPEDEKLGYRRSEPGMVGTFLCDARLRGSLIVDGRHLHPELVRALVELRGADSVTLVSDATPAAGLPPGRYRMGGLEAEVHAEGYATAAGGLAGSVIPLVTALREAVRSAQLPLADAVRMATATPAGILGLGQRKGRVAPGFDADLLLLDADLCPRAVYRAGALLPGR